MSKTKSFETTSGQIVLDARKVAYLPATRTLLVADMHFEKGSYLREVGLSVLPALDTEDTIARLREIVTDYQPEKIVALGDSFHDVNADQRLSQHAADQLNSLTHVGCEFVWILGNHDPDIPAGLMGRREDHILEGGFLLTHQPYEIEGSVNICGHYHPKAKIRSRAGSVTAPCFAISKSRVIMPAFGTYTGGLYVSDPAFIDAMPDMECMTLAYERRLFPISLNV